MVNSFIAIVGLVVAVGGIVLAILRRGKQYREVNEKKQFPAPVLLIIAGCVLGLLSQSFTVIPTGYSGVKTTFGQISESTVQNGINFKIPFAQSIEMVNNKMQDIKYADQIWSETSDRTAIYYSDVTVTYQINNEKSAWIYANVGNYQENLVSQTLVASALKASSKSLKDTDATNRSIIEPAAQESIQQSLDDKYGKDIVFIRKVVIGGADFEESYNQAIADKQNAQLAYEKQQIENQNAIEKAEADAEAKRIAAEGEADANKILADSLSDDIFKQMMLEKWDGQLPKVTDSGSNVFDVTGLLGEEEDGSQGTGTAEAGQ